MSCKNCIYVPRTYEEYCLSKTGSEWVHTFLCPNAFEKDSSECELFEGEEDEDELSHC